MRGAISPMRSRTSFSTGSIITWTSSYRMEREMVVASVLGVDRMRRKTRRCEARDGDLVPTRQSQG
jgi:hypothetical protein